MVSVADPLAEEATEVAGAEVLRATGSAIDTAMHVELTVGLLEPESSRLCGGGLLIHFIAEHAAIDAYDGREWASSAAGADLFPQDGRRCHAAGSGE